MDKQDNGGSAFPVTHSVNYSLGMSLRDWFAGQALAGLMGQIEGKAVQQNAARASYIIADAMIKTRKV